MDGKQFDALTRAIGAGASRRGLLKTLATGAFGALAAAIGGEAAEAARCRSVGNSCSVNADCCSGSCVQESRTRKICHCTAASQCPTIDACHAPTCSGGVCGSILVPCQPLDVCHVAGVCDAASGQCSNPPGPAGIACGSGPRCDGDIAVGQDACDGDGNCATGPQTHCAPYVCQGASCLTSCGGDLDCSAGNYCAGSQCVPQKAQGTACAAEYECVSGFCVDGVCCDGLCGGQCEACNQSGNLGTCVAVTGAPVGGRSACISDGSVCGGACDGIDHDACAYPGAATVCRDASCSDGTETLTATCDGAGSCPSATTQACDPYLCGATACATSCADDTECAGDGYCDTTTTPGVCRQDLPLGVACLRDAQCLTGYCVDGACCGSACPPPANGSAVCPAGVCGIVCDAGYHTCDNLTCVSDDDPDSCGPTTCAPCPDGPADSYRTCSAGVCGWVCDEDFHHCADESPDGVCLSDYSVDSCGTSCTPCPAGPANSHRTCTSGICGYACDDFYKPCGTLCIPLAACCTDADCAGLNGATCHDHACCGYPEICGTAPDDFCCANGSKCVGATCHACTTMGSTCDSDADCCAGTCQGADPEFGLKGSCVCNPSGMFCGDPLDCCSGVCNNGFCCGGPGASCSSPGPAAQCCSGTCGGSAPSFTCV